MEFWLAVLELTRGSGDGAIRQLRRSKNEKRPYTIELQGFAYHSANHVHLSNFMLGGDPVLPP